MKALLPCLAILLLGSATAADAAPCDAAELRQFDFWLGEWTVHRPDGQQVGTNSIQREYGGCVIHERYTTPRAYAGESLNTWDTARKVWHQSWVDNGGTLLLLDGRLVDRAMVLEGPGQDEKGQAVRHRITWTPNADGTVRQHWETAGADGQWKTAFDGLYRKKP